MLVPAETLSSFAGARLALASPTVKPHLEPSVPPSLLFIQNCFLLHWGLLLCCLIRTRYRESLPHQSVGEPIGCILELVCWVYIYSWICQLLLILLGRRPVASVSSAKLLFLCGSLCLLGASLFRFRSFAFLGFLLSSLVPVTAVPILIVSNQWCCDGWWCCQVCPPRLQELLLQVHRFPGASGLLRLGCFLLSSFLLLVLSGFPPEQLLSHPVRLLRHPIM